MPTIVITITEKIERTGGGADLYGYAYSHEMRFEDPDSRRRSKLPQFAFSFPRIVGVLLTKMAELNGGRFEEVRIDINNLSSFDDFMIEIKRKLEEGENFFPSEVEGAELEWGAE